MDRTPCAWTVRQRAGKRGLTVALRGILTLARISESGQVELSVRLIVGGTPIAGILTSTTFFYEWLQGLLALGMVTGSPMPGEATAPQPTAEERSAVTAAWESEAKQRGGDMEIPQICLRNAVVMAGVVAYWQRFPYLLIEVDAIQAYTVAGVPSDDDGPTG